MSAAREQDDAAFATVVAAGLGIVLVVAAGATLGGRTAAAVAVGAAIAVANLAALRATIRALVRPPREDEVPADADAEEGAAEDPALASRRARDAGRRGGVGWGIFAVLKIAVLFGGVWILLTRGLVAPIPLVVGYAVLPLGIVATTLRTSMRPRRRR